MYLEKDKAKQRAEELLRRMTREEKIGQLCVWGISGTEPLGVKGQRPKGLAELISQGNAGAIIQPCQDLSDYTVTLQKIAVEESRLHIPLMFNSDAVHGFDTVFPVPLAASCSFDTDLVEKAAHVVADEASATGINYTNAPMIDLSRDPRWGRIVESQGEDAYLAGEMAKACVRGFQKGEFGILATLKHYAGYGACEGGRDYGASEVSENTMLNQYLVPFREGVTAGASSVMSSFNTIENIPATGNKKYLRDILRGRFGFDGITVSDAMSVPEMMAHGYCATSAECALKALRAGLDMELGTNCYLSNLGKLLENGKIEEALLDEAVLRILTKKYELGLFDDPYRFFKRGKGNIFSVDNLDLSEQLASESAVLLENNGILPLKQRTKIAVIGEYATSKDLLGCWQASSKKKNVTPLCEALKSDFRVVGISADYDITRAETVSYQADTVIFTFGESTNENGEATSKHNLRVAPQVAECFHYLKSRGKKVVVLVFSGRPLIVNDFRYADALMYCWDLGHRASETVCKLLSGKYVPSGKLTVTFIRAEGQIPMYYAHKPSGRPFLPEQQENSVQVRYCDGENYPQYPFGYGLSYTSFRYGNVRADKKSMKHGEQITVSAEIKNVGKCDGTEIVQLYLSDPFAEISRPVRELKDFCRVFLKRGESKIISFTINEDKLKYYHADGTYSADAGLFRVFVGGDSRALNCVEVELTE